MAKYDIAMRTGKWAWGGIDLSLPIKDHKRLSILSTEPLASRGLWQFLWELVVNSSGI